MEKKTSIYHPILYIVLTFGITWVCAFFITYQTILDCNNYGGMIVLKAVDFLESASPLLVALLLQRKRLLSGRALTHFFLGEKSRLWCYIAVIILFAWQFFTFSFFPIGENTEFTICAFLSMWGGQILFGGGLEEGGWRGYLQPAFERKVPALVSVLGVSLVWSFWHFPYFFLPNNMHSGSNFLIYIVTSTATAFTLTAIYKLTGSVLLCTLFHGWQNAIVMSFGANMGNLGFLIMFGLQTAVSIILCVKLSSDRSCKKKEHHL